MAGGRPGEFGEPSSNSRRRPPDRTTASAPGAAPPHGAPAIAEAHLAPLRPHDLRHTAVALWIAQGGSPKQIATWAGHTSVSVVLDRYGHLFPGHEATIMERLEASYTAPVAPSKAEVRSPPGVPSTSPE